LARGAKSPGGAPLRAVIAHLSGTLLDKQLQRLVVDVGGVGYDVQVPLSTFYAVGDVGAHVALRIHTHVREDALQLFGFATPLEQALFERLIAISGIGPRVALAVLSGIEPESLVRAIRDADLGRLTSIPGVGKKTAERLVVEMRDRLPKTADMTPHGTPGAVDDVRSDVLSALANLGYQRAAAERGLERVLTTSESRDFEDVLRAILKDLAR
jgi:Holliday junction DNA helicase RuvA